jgi:hypothetical protein
MNLHVGWVEQANSVVGLGRGSMAILAEDGSQPRTGLRGPPESGGLDPPYSSCSMTCWQLGSDSKKTLP